MRRPGHEGGDGTRCLVRKYRKSGHVMARPRRVASHDGGADGNTTSKQYRSADATPAIDCAGHKATGKCDSAAVAAHLAKFRDRIGELGYQSLVPALIDRAQAWLRPVRHR